MRPFLSELYKYPQYGKEKGLVAYESPSSLLLWPTVWLNEPDGLGSQEEFDYY